MTTIALLLNEVDLKNGNMAINDKNQIVKFDGDWCFAYLRDSWSGCGITENELKMLPFLGNYNAWNWLGIKNGGVLSGDPLLDKDISTNPQFRAEVNHALLKALVLPNHLIKTFVSTYIPDAKEAKTIYDEFIKRREQLFQAALKNQSFLNYLKTDKPEKQLAEYANHLKGFKTTKKNYLISAMDTADPKKLLLDKLAGIRRKAFPVTKEEKALPTAGISIVVTPPTDAKTEAERDAKLRTELAIAAKKATQTVPTGTKTYHLSPKVIQHPGPKVASIKPTRGRV